MPSGALSENDPCKTPKGQDGTCKNVRKCPELLNLLKSRQPGSADYLRRSTCGYVNRDPIVCCVRTTVATNNPTITPNTTINSRSQILPGLDVCGRSDVFHIRVVGGQSASLGELYILGKYSVIK